jgi:hypothetical protein
MASSADNAGTEPGKAPRQKVDEIRMEGQLQKALGNKTWNEEGSPYQRQYPLECAVGPPFLVCHAVELSYCLKS